jgi:ubiquinone/menaquinone biosynthesis C-methylase UbiE
MLSPKKIVDGIHLKKSFKSDDVILDMGSGSGSFTFPILHRTGKQNNVIAVDIDPEMLRKVKDHAIIGGYGLETVLADIENSLVFKDNYADYVFLTNVLHQLENKYKIISEIYRVLKRGGEFVLIDWHPDSQFGPSKEVRVNMENLLDNLEKYFIIKNKLDAGQYHFGYILAKK